jgi:hypothetical protein
LSEKPRDNLEDNNSIGIMAFARLIHEFRRCGIYEKYKLQLERTIKYNLSDILAAFFHRKPEKEFSRMVTDYQSFIKQQFAESSEAKYII